MTQKAETGSVRDRLIEAALGALSEAGYKGATTRAIAASAGVSEVTLFRHFASKANLVGAALEHATAALRSVESAPSGDVVDDLANLADGYVRFIDRWPALADRVLPEVATDSELGEQARSILASNAEAVRSLVEKHQAAGALVDEPVAAVIRAFLGPLLARATLRAVLPPDSFDASAYVIRFLEGFSPNSRL